MTAKISCCEQARDAACGGRPRRRSARLRPAPSRKQKYDRDGRPYYGANGPNVSYQQGPRTRVYVTTRSWLDAGTEVLPGDRKFQDYAFPPTAIVRQQNLNRPLDRASR